MAVTIIADDLSGACDAGALFAGRGPVGVFVAPDLPDARRHAAAVDTERRTLPPPDAAARPRASRRVSATAASSRRSTRPSGAT